MIECLQSFGQFSNCNFLCNTDFEDEKLVQNGQFGFFNEDRVSCWETTASDNMIEIWGSGFGGVPAFSGNQFAELNANMVSTLYQNFAAGLGGEVEISFAHRGRAGVDRMSVKIGPVTGPFEDLGTFSADNKKWEFHTLNYSFPKTGSIEYAIRFESISAAGGATVGNFLDAISIKLYPPKADFNVINPICSNDSTGRIEIKSISGSRPFQYKWSSTFNSKDTFANHLAKGNYELIISDFFGCQIKYDFQLMSSREDDTTKFIQTSCQSYTWPSSSNTYTESGLYMDRYKNSSGCDSIIQLQLTIHKSDTQIISHTQCTEYTWPISGISYTKSGKYYKNYSNTNGCDSVLILDLQINQPQEVYFKEKHCKTFFWQANQTYYTKSGLYNCVYKNKNACDSILYLELEITEPDIINQKIFSCGSFINPNNGKIYTQSTQIVDSFVNQYNCDSIISLDLNISPIDSMNEFQTNCNSYYWPVNQQTYTKSGRYIQSYQNSHSCDSNVILNLTILENSRSIQTVTSCDSYYSQINGKNYTQSGNYSVILPNFNGCDSIINLKLQINKSNFKFDTIRSCDAYYWTVNGVNYTQSGDFISKFQTVESCDSIFHLHLNIQKSNIIIDTITAFEFYDWKVNKEHYLLSGIYQQTFTNRLDCDSIRILVLEIKKNGQVFVPNVFSPNQDLVNDFAVVYSTPEISIIDRFRIFTRWGELVFDKKNFIPNIDELGWDGRFKNEKINPAVFPYVVEWTDNLGAKRILYGDITLIK
ncbi:MAG: gliding motility-associated C-terminal domain-containing protein [Saprospiraceae bacterium]